jgi:ATP-binding cassette subfamily F protein 3
VEVRDGRVTSYSGQYDAYVYKVNKEIEAGERELASVRTKLPAAVLARPTVAKRDERKVRKEIKAIEQTVAQLDEQKRTAYARLQASTDADEALRLHNEVETLTAQLAEAEQRWCELQDELE